MSIKCGNEFHPEGSKELLDHQKKIKTAQVHQLKNRQRYNELARARYKLNSDKYKKKSRDYYHKNPKKKRTNPKVVCTCGAISSRNNLKKHMLTKKHISSKQ